MMMLRGLTFVPFPSLSWALSSLRHSGDSRPSLTSLASPPLPLYCVTGELNVSLRVSFHPRLPISRKPVHLVMDLRSFLLLFASVLLSERFFPVSYINSMRAEEATT